MKKEVRKKRKINLQKVFNLISAMFILACIIFYGSRFIKLYLENNEKEKIITLGDKIKENSKNLKEINGDYYFQNSEENNYIKYSNLIFRIVKINKDNSVTIISDNSITSLAKGEKDYISKWLNKDNDKYSGILEKNLNNKAKYLTYTKTCNDNVKNTKKISCENQINDQYITVPSINDYVNTGGQKGFINNEEYFYLINENDNNKTWYIDDKGKVNTSDNTDILGIKPEITIKNTITLKSGTGSKEDPYIFEEETGLFGKYVKLDNDIWRIYNVDKENVKLSLDSYLKINNEEITYKYSLSGYYHNDSKAGTLAYYLKNNYLKTLNYKNIVNDDNFANGIYNNTTDFDYTKVLSTTVPTKISVLSIGDIILNAQNTNYYTSTGLEKNSNLVYIHQNDFKTYTKMSTNDLKIVPVISIKKDLLTSGDGTIDNPLEVK